MMWAMFKYGIGISDCGVLRYTQRTWTERQGVMRAERGNLVFHIVVSAIHATHVNGTISFVVGTSSARRFLEAVLFFQSAELVW